MCRRSKFDLEKIRRVLPNNVSVLQDHPRPEEQKRGAGGANGMSVVREQKFVPGRKTRKAAYSDN